MAVGVTVLPAKEGASLSCLESENSIRGLTESLVSSTGTQLCRGCRPPEKGLELLTATVVPSSLVIYLSSVCLASLTYRVRDTIHT